MGSRTILEALGSQFVYIYLTQMTYIRVQTHSIITAIRQMLQDRQYHNPPPDAPLSHPYVLTKQIPARPSIKADLCFRIESTPYPPYVHLPRNVITRCGDADHNNCDWSACPMFAGAWINQSLRYESLTAVYFSSKLSTLWEVSLLT